MKPGSSCKGLRTTGQIQKLDGTHSGVFKEIKCEISNLPQGQLFIKTYLLTRDLENSKVNAYFKKESRKLQAS